MTELLKVVLVGFGAKSKFWGTAAACPRGYLPAGLKYRGGPLSPANQFASRRCTFSISVRLQDHTTAHVGYSAVSKVTQHFEMILYNLSQSV